MSDAEGSLANPAVTVPANTSSAGFTATVSLVEFTDTIMLLAKRGQRFENLYAAVERNYTNAEYQRGCDVVVNTVAKYSVTLVSTGTASVTINTVALTGAGLHSVWPRTPSHVESEPGGDPECAVRSDRHVSRLGSAHYCQYLGLSGAWGAKCPILQ